MRKYNAGVRGLAAGTALVAAAIAAVTVRPVAPASPAAPRPAPKPVSPQAVPILAGLTEGKTATTQAKVTDSPFTLTASLDSAVAESQPVMLTLELRNDGAETRTIGGSAFEESSFRIAVTNGAGQPVLRTAAGERVLTPPTAVTANAMIVIAPGKTLHYRYNLARLFDLSRAGDYTVSVARTVTDWPFRIGAPALGRPNPPQEAHLSLDPLPFHVVDDPASVSGPTAATLPGSQTFLYAVSPYTPGVVRYRVGDDGGVSFAVGPAVPAPASLAPTPSLGTGSGMTVATPDGRFLYSGNGDHTISQFRIGDDGVLSPLSPPTVSAPQGPRTLLMDPRGRFLCALPGGVFSIGPDGRLTSTGALADMPSTPAGCAIDGTGSHLYISNGLTHGYRIDDGRLTAMPMPAKSASGADTGSDSAIALAPSGRFAYIGVSTQGGSAFFDLVAPMRVAADGKLTPIPGAARAPQAPAYPPGYMPYQCNSLAVDPTGRFLIVVNSGYLDGFRIEADGTLTPLGMTLMPGNLTSVFFLPNHPIAYVLRSNSPSLIAFRLDETRGLVPATLDMPDGISFQASVASAVAPVPERWGAAAGGLKVSARLPADDVPADKPIILTVTLRNVSNAPLSLGALDADMAALHLSVTGPQRQSPGVLRGSGEPATTQAPLLAAGRDLFGVSKGGGAPIVLPPGEERAYRLVLTRLFDMTVAGNYTVQVTRALPGGGAASTPVVPLLIEGPFNGVSWNTRGTGGWQGMDVF